MNELYAADPSVCGHFSELKMLLGSFGPYAGRYLANYPTDWGAQVESKLEILGEIEAARVKLLLRRARENLTLVTRANLAWSDDQAWLENASPLLKGNNAIFQGLITSKAIPPAIHDLHELDLPPTADERVLGTAQEYARIAKIILLLSPELAFIDPYLNPLKRSCASVLTSLLELVAKGKCQKVTMWARASEVIGNSNPETIKRDLQEVLQRLFYQAGFRQGREIELILVEDESRQTKMHGRYLVSIKGGVRLDQGFQQLPIGRKVDVGPVGKLIHNELLDNFFDMKHDMNIKLRLIHSARTVG